MKKAPLATFIPRPRGAAALAALCLAAVLPFLGAARAAAGRLAPGGWGIRRAARSNSSANPIPLNIAGR